MSKDDLARTKTVRIVSCVQMPDEMFFQGRAQSCAMAISGAVAAAACPQASKEPKDEILDAMKAHGISDFVTPQNSANTGGHEFQQYLEQPELLRATWANVSQIVSGMLVDDLAKKK